MKTFKMLMAVLLCLSMLALCSCGDSQQPSGQNAPTTDPTGQNDPIPNTSDTQYAVTMSGAELFKGSDDEDVLRIYYDFTNNSEDTISAFASLTFSAQQNEQDLEMAYSFDNAVPEASYGMSGVRPGVTLRCAEEYTVDLSAGDVSFYVTELFDEDVVYIDEVLDLNNLPGAPAEAFAIAELADPAWTENLSDSGSLTGVEVYIDTAEIVEDYSGANVLRVYMDVTNISEEAVTPSYDMICEAYQDGVQLDIGFPDETVAEDENMSNELAPGETVRAATSFTLRSDSNVEVEVSELFNDTVIGSEFELSL